MGGRTDAQTVRDFCTRAGGSPAEARNALDRLEARLADAEYIGALNKALNEQNASLTLRLVAVEDALRGLLDYIGVDLEDSAEQLESFDAPSVVVSACRLLAAAAADTGQGAAGVE